VFSTIQERVFGSRIVRLAFLFSAIHFPLLRGGKTLEVKKKADLREKGTSNQEIAKAGSNFRESRRKRYIRKEQ